MWKYLSTRAPAFRNFRLVAPIDVDESKDLRRGKDRIEADEYVFMYGASRACSERFSLAFHGMRSCFKILANLASLSLSSPPIFRAACLFGQCRSRRNRLFPPFLFFLLFPFALVNNAIYIYSTEKYTDVSPARWHFRFPHSPPSFAVHHCRRASHRWRKNVSTKSPPRAFIRRISGIPSKVYSALSLRLMLHLSRWCNAIPSPR